MANGHNGLGGQDCVDLETTAQFRMLRFELMTRVAVEPDESPTAEGRLVAAEGKQQVNRLCP